MFFDQKGETVRSELYMFFTVSPALIALSQLNCFAKHYIILHIFLVFRLAIIINLEHWPAHNTVKYFAQSGLRIRVERKWPLYIFKNFVIVGKSFHLGSKRRKKILVVILQHFEAPQRAYSLQKMKTI